MSANHIYKNHPENPGDFFLTNIQPGLVTAMFTAFRTEKPFDDIEESWVVTL